MTKRKHVISIGWDDPDDAEAVAQVLMDAAVRGSKIVDHGFYDDARELFDKASEVRNEDRGDDEAP